MLRSNILTSSHTHELDLCTRMGNEDLQSITRKHTALHACILTDMLTYKTPVIQHNNLFIFILIYHFANILYNYYKMYNYFIKIGLYQLFI